jgi:hypothetical protein
LNAINSPDVLTGTQGEPAETQKLHSQAREGQERHKAALRVSVVDALGRLAAVHYDRGELIEAEALYLRLLEGNAKLVGSGDPSTLAIVENLTSKYSLVPQVSRNE